MATSAAGTRKALFVYLPALAVLAADQLTKDWVRKQLPLGVPVPVASHLNWYHVINKGGAFSLLYGNVWFLALVSLAVTGGIIAYERRLPEMVRSQAIALGILLGGTLGNCLDRVVFGQVTDFIDVSLGSRHWPTFNLADIGINLGVLVLLLVSARGPATPAAPPRR